MHCMSVIVLAFAVIPSISADSCCQANDGGNCADGTVGTPCCGYKSCDIFCCDCGGNCRGASKRDALLLSSTLHKRDSAVDTFAQADVAGTGNLTFGQYLAFMGVEEGNELWTEYFNKHDKNEDGVVIKDEVYA